MKGWRRWGATVMMFSGVALLGCATTTAQNDGLDPSTLPAGLREDYAVFAQRCSKCHSLARPLNSGISDQNYWQLYVARMRRQPGSGISQEDAEPILRFLRFYSIEQQQKEEKGHPSPVSPPVGHSLLRPRF